MEAKMNKPKTSKFPKTALAFYIKLYCKRKGSSKTKCQNNLVEATKSWLSFSETEKQQFSAIYKESEHKFKLQILDQLKNAEPFLKVKDSTGLKNVDLYSSRLVIQEPEAATEKVNPQIETEHAKQIENDEDILGCGEELVTASGPEHYQEKYNETISEPIDINTQNPGIFLVEPKPPALKTSKDLFHMLNIADGANSISWTELSTFEKNQYRRAVFLLKKDYITKFKEYLESLSPRELFDYYNKTMF